MASLKCAHNLDFRRRYEVSSGCTCYYDDNEYTNSDELYLINFENMRLNIHITNEKLEFLFVYLLSYPLRKDLSGVDVIVSEDFGEDDLEKLFVNKPFNQNLLNKIFNKTKRYLDLQSFR